MDIDHRDNMVHVALNPVLLISRDLSVEYMATGIWK